MEAGKINNLSTNQYSSLANAGQESTKKANSFGNFLKNAINDVNNLQQNASMATRKLVTGDKKDIHNTMIALQKAQVSFELIVQIQNKLMTAYDELKRMQI